MVALSPPLPLPCLSIGAHKAGRHHHLKKARGTAEEEKKRPPAHTPFPHVCLLCFRWLGGRIVGVGSGAFLDLALGICLRDRENILIWQDRAGGRVALVR